MDIAAAMYDRLQVDRKGIHTRYPDPVQTTGYLVGILVELTPGVEYGHDDLQRRLIELGVHPRRDTATVVLDGDAVVFVYDDVDLATVPRQMFVD